jgi:hypothetical protein
MFTKLAKSGLVKFWPVQPQRIARVLHEVRLCNATHCNDNLPGLRRPKDQRRIPSPALVCHWIDRNGRLECRWQAEPAAPAANEDLDSGPAKPKAISLPYRRDLSGLVLTIRA